MGMPASPVLPPPTAEMLRREVRYRLSYRGTLELDCLCRAALPHIEALSPPELLALRDFLLESENDLMHWLVEGHPVPEAYAPLIAQLKGWFAQQRQQRENR